MNAFKPIVINTGGTGISDADNLSNKACCHKPLFGLAFP